MARQFHDLLSRVSGQELHIPDLTSLLGNWQTKINPHLEELRPLVRRMIEGVVNNPQKLNKIIDCDFARLACLICPNAGWKELHSLAMFLVWIFVWDDDLDLPYSEVASTKGQAIAYCRESVESARKSLSLTRSGGVNDVKVRAPFPIMGLFDEFASTLLGATDQAQRQRVFAEIEVYISEVAGEHARQYDKILPNVDEYLQMRMGTSGIMVFLAFSDCINGIRLPEWVMQSDEMTTLKIETTRLAMFVNDIYSLKKEIISQTPQNIVPILLHRSKGKTLDETMLQLSIMFRTAAQQFENGFDNLVVKVKDDHVVDKDMHVYADSCRTLVTGLIEWSKKTARYNLSQYEDEGGVFKIPL